MSDPITARVQRRRCRAEWQRILTAQSSSGLGQEAYCQQQGIAYSSFCRWKRALTAQKEPAPTRAVASAFIALEPAAALVAPCWDVELELGEGVFLRLRRS